MTGDGLIIDAAAQQWWEAAAEDRLLVQECECGVRQHPPRAVCTGCGDMGSLSLRESAGRGIVDAWTLVARAPRSGIEPGFIVARVRLEEGPIMLTHLIGNAPWQSGDPVVLDWIDFDGARLPVFRRDES